MSSGLNCGPQRNFEYEGKIMKKYVEFLILFFLTTSIVCAQDIIYPYGANAPVDSDIKNLEWNRYSNDDIVILSIDNEQGKWLNSNIESMRFWCLGRWGFPESRFTKECRIFCVPNKQLLKKLFNLEQSKFELRKDVTAIWFSMEDGPSSILPPLLTQICLSEFEIKHNVKFGLWFKHGISQLNGVTSDIRKNITNLKQQSVLTSEKIFTMTEEDYFKENVEIRRIFDKQSLILCVMLRKEFGEAKLQGFLRIASNNKSQDVLRVVYGFSGFVHFDKQYYRFIQDLASDVLNNKTPDAYLEIKAVR